MNQYECEINTLVRKIDTTNISDYDIVSGYVKAYNRYKEAVTEGNGLLEPIRTRYINKEAYRIVAERRGYDVKLVEV